METNQIAGQVMNTIRTTIVDGHVHVPVPNDLPNGTRVDVRIVPVVEKIGLDESEWRTDEAAMREWNEWLTKIEPIEFSPPDDFDRKFRAYNINAVREQMFGEQQ
jgi:hypothetical protein